MNRGLVRLACMAAAGALLGACATPPSLPPIPAGQSVAISVAATSQALGAIPINNAAMGEGVSAGVGTGAVAGGLWGLGCGPLAFLCVPLGAVVGMVTGSAAGAVVGVTGALPNDKTTQLRERMARLAQSHPLPDELQRQLSERARKYWTLDAGAPGTRVLAEMQLLQLTSTRDERIRCAMQVLVTVSAGDGSTAGAGRQKVYTYESPFAALSLWLDESNDFVDTLFTSASQQLAAQIVADLTAR